MVQKLQVDGFTFQSYALAAHSLAALPSGTVEVLGIFPNDSPKIVGTQINAMWEQHKGGSLQEENGREMPMPMFYRACQGHSTFVASVERMYVPCDPGQVRSHGCLLHFTGL
eukprot:4155358-Pyramimonas_sp.AAC.1